MRQRVLAAWCRLRGHRYAYRLVTVDPDGHRFCDRCGRNV